VSACIQGIEADKENYEKEILSIQEKLASEGITVSFETLYDEEILKDRIANQIRSTELENHGYIWVNEILNFEGGEKYAIRRVHSNLEETEGDYLSTDIKDLRGNTPYLTELNGIKENGSLFFSYWFKKMNNDEIVEKLTYAQLYKDFNWIIATGVYLDDIEKIIKLEERKIENKIHSIIRISVISSLIIALLSYLIALLLNRKMKKDLHDYEYQIKEKELELESIVEMRTEEIRISREKYLNLYNNSPDMYFSASAETGLIEICNKTIEEKFSLEKETLIGESFYSLFIPEEKEIINKAMVLFNKNGKVENIELTMRTPGTGTIKTTMSIRYQEKTQGINDLFLATLRDITDLVTIHEEKATLERNLLSSQKLEAIGTLAGGIAHDFNNSLSAIMNSAQLLASPAMNLNLKGEKYVRVILQASAQAAELTKKLLTFGRKGRNVLTTINMYSLIEETLILLDRIIDKRISLSFKKQGEKSFIIGDYAAIQSIIMNLCINAVHAMPSGGQIRINCRNRTMNESACNTTGFNLQPGEYLMITIEDTGEGIPAEFLGKIFEPFFTTKEKGKGTGLGLATTIATLRDHKGSIKVQSEVGVGTIFELLLPLTENTVSADTSDHTIISGHGRILFVDDEELVRDVGENLITSLGYDVVTAADGEEAIEIYRSDYQNIDLVILDMIMPKMNGRDTFTEMKKINRDCRILISSGYTDEQTTMELLAMGLAGTLDKPYTDYSLSQIISRILKGK
jgi:PAS domain S-box-containing protein